MNDKISIIVPIYKVEKYLDKCIESLVNQTYTNLEIILVDDGSPDKCPEMCDKWAEKDSRIKVIHKPNGGLSDARNAGMKEANGEYIVFTDSDDFLDKHFIEYLYIAIIDNEVEMSSCDFAYYYDGDIVTNEVTRGKITVSSSETAIEDILNNRNVRAVAWNKMFHRGLLVGEEFPVGKYHEDEFFSYRIIHKAKKIAYIDSALYYYRQREGSIMASFNIKHLDSLEAGLERLSLLKKYYPDLYIYDKATFCMGCVLMYLSALDDKECDKKEIKKIIKSKRKQVKVNIKEFSSYSFKKKLYVICGRYFLGVFSWILKSLRRNCGE